ncbi:MAG: hypothetical protein IJR59_07765, partial [Firmicutes bacterium]|nr:hypothetical protein [Bacillota bacterium]
MKELERLLLPLKRAVIRYNFINYAILALALGLTADIAVSAASKFVLVRNLYMLLVCIPLVCVGIALLAALLLRPKTDKLCKTADKQGLKERCITAYELLKKGKTDELDILEISDTIDILRTINFETEYKPGVWLNILKYCGAAFLALIVITALPSPRRNALDMQADVYERGMEEYEKIEKAAEELSV